MRTKSLLTLIVIIAVLMGVSALAMAKESLPEAKPDALWKYITKTSDYTTWEYWPDHQGLQPGNAPHGTIQQVFVNDRAVNSPKPPVQYGAIVVKENYNDARALLAITVMYKKAGYNPDHGDWYWVKYTPEGLAGPEGKPKGCIGCHVTRANNDYILVHEF